MATIKVKFRQAFYDGEKFYEKGETYELPANFPIPTRDIEIVEGKSTYKKPSAKRVVPAIKMKKDVATALRNVQAEKAGEAEE